MKNDIFRPVLSRGFSANPEPLDPVMDYELFCLDKFNVKS